MLIVIVSIAILAVPINSKTLDNNDQRLLQENGNENFFSVCVCV